MNDIKKKILHNLDWNSFKIWYNTMKIRIYISTHLSPFTAFPNWSDSKSVCVQAETKSVNQEAEGRVFVCALRATMWLCVWALLADNGLFSLGSMWRSWQTRSTPLYIPQTEGGGPEITQRETEVVISPDGTTSSPPWNNSSIIPRTLISTTTPNRIVPTDFLLMRLQCVCRT